LIWLTTVDPKGAPQPSPVWFLWSGSEILIYSEPDKPKLRNIEQNPRVSLHFDGDGQGGDIVIIRGQARIAMAEPPATDVPDYARKYDAGGFYKRTGFSGAAFARRRVLAIVDEQEVTVVALDTGEILSTHLIEPDRRYWRNQRRDPGRWPGSQATR